ncbi:alpha/beta hydrolase fold domain-containing protein [Hymenobacter sp. DH14]|uniref:Alpha/beta hydrolase fold domain-containing protein n=1 Tax=Hymenobacter cyanobacteriorum TaxID=2926463 RepID=A0A9X2AIM6_9BACT|nr:alpha/beta hydrolase fold domain-containing protein [Hymenobacter cyanobacteriorum]MCI1190148.1 alpha/beta hydrolase fold domain-containing protein [Hymenobacter cyanobacteriorum]
MKTKLLLLLLLMLGAGPAARAQIDTTGGRYYRPIFSSAAVTPDVDYGAATNYDGTAAALKMDIYQPVGDVVARRPVIIFAHQGGFLAGTRKDAYMVNICTRMARLGYVAASIEYRLGFPITGFPPPAADTVGVAQAAVRGMQDLRAAVRFFRKDAATTNTYRVNPSYIAVGGSSAGAFMALEVGYLDKASEVPAYVGLAALGGIEGNSGNPGYSSAVLAVLNLSGATENPSLIEAGNAPLLSVHGTADNTVPYFQGRVGSLLPPKYVYGSGRLNPRATAVGVRNTLVRLSRAGHIPFEGNTAYADTTFRAIRDFLRPSLGQAGTVLAARAGSGQPVALAQAYPNPAADQLRLQLPEAWPLPAQVELRDATGRLVRSFSSISRELLVSRGSLPAGLYLLAVPGQLPVRIEFQ